MIDLDSLCFRLDLAQVVVSEQRPTPSAPVEFCQYFLLDLAEY
jgi:hypothetical protein